MPELKINGITARVADGATVLEAAQQIAVEIPTLCHLKGMAPETSCMLCMVKDNASGRLIPACSARAVGGMDIDTECAEIQTARRDILNLLLSEHVGDCEAPCTRICPAHLDIPRMLREIGRGNVESAAWIARRDLAIPASLGYVCPAPCEKGCRRGQVDTAITIRELHRQVAIGFQSSEFDFPDREEKTAVIGSGPAGLASAWSLRLRGYCCTVFDEAAVAGGSLRQDEKLPAAVLAAEVESLRSAGIGFRLGSAVSLPGIQAEFDGVIIAETGLEETPSAGVFYAEGHKLAVKAVANGKAAAAALDRFLKGADSAAGERFDSKIGKLHASEVREFVKNCAAGGPADPAAEQREAARCLHCDCRKPVSCRLRLYAERYGADPREFPVEERAQVQIIGHNESVVFEPGKCIKCGLCVKITRSAGEELGLAFVGRGFRMQVAVPFGEALRSGLRKTAQECVEACPTGALAFREGEELRTET